MWAPTHSVAWRPSRHFASIRSLGDKNRTAVLQQYATVREESAFWGSPESGLLYLRHDSSRGSLSPCQSDTDTQCSSPLSVSVLSYLTFPLLLLFRGQGHTQLYNTAKATAGNTECTECTQLKTVFFVLKLCFYLPVKTMLSLLLNMVHLVLVCCTSASSMCQGLFQNNILCQSNYLSQYIK